MNSQWEKNYGNHCDKYRSESIPTRSTENPKIKFEKMLDKLMRKNGIPILSYVLGNISGLSNMSTYDALNTTYTQFKDTMVDLLWHLAYFFTKCRLGWSSFRSDVSVVEHSGKTNFTLLPITDLDPNDYSYLCSKFCSL